MNEQRIMARYRELGSSLEASRQVLAEAGCQKWHRYGERCICGYLSVPSPFYAAEGKQGDKDFKERTHEEAEKAYLEWLGSDERPEWVNPPVLREVVTKSPDSVTKLPNNVTCDETSVTKASPESAKEVPRRKTGRPKRYESAAERQKAYRSRHGD